MDLSNDEVEEANLGMRTMICLDYDLSWLKPLSCVVVMECQSDQAEESERPVVKENL